MLKIEEDMLAAIADKRSWDKGNTQVICHNGYIAVYLHEYRIAYFDKVSDSLVIDFITAHSWPTRTTCSRLRALGFNVRIKQGVFTWTP